ncbi:MAG: hypothetical protein EOO36_14245, partial [Cytophagaceae bacterium]
MHSAVCPKRRCLAPAGRPNLPQTLRFRPSLFARLALLLGLLANPGWARAQKSRLVVAADGSGDYRTVQQALDAVPTGQTQPTTIFIKRGVYKEKLTLAAGQNFVRLLGEDAATTVLTYDDYAQKQTPKGQNIGTYGSASF